MPPNLNISYITYVTQRKSTVHESISSVAVVTFKWQASSVSCSPEYRISIALCPALHPLSLPPLGVFLLITFHSALLFPSSSSDPSSCPLPPCHPSSLSLLVCLLSCMVLQGSLADVIYAISFTSERREHPEANTPRAACSCGRLWACTGRATLFLYFTIPPCTRQWIYTAVHINKQ